MVIASGLSKNKMQQIVDEYNNELNRIYTDEEIISLMKTRIENSNKSKEEYVSKREYWWLTGGFFTQEKYTLPSIQETEQKIIYNHLEKFAQSLNLDIYFAFFKEYGYDLCYEYIKYFSENKVITNKMTDEQVISIYKKFINGNCSNKGFYNVIRKTRELVLDKKCQELLPVSQEIATRLNTLSNGPLLSSSEVYDININKKDMKEIIENLCSKNYIGEFCFPQISHFFSYRKDLINKTMQTNIFNLIYKYQEGKYFVNATYTYNSNRNASEFLFLDVLTDEQKKLILSKLYKTMNEFSQNYYHPYDSYEKNLDLTFNWKYGLLNDFEKNYPEKEKFEDTILNEIIEETKNSRGLYLSKCYELMKYFIKLSDGNFSEETINNVYQLVGQDNKLGKTTTSTSDMEQCFQKVKKK